MAKCLEWTQELIDHIVLKWKKGFSAREIAKDIPGTNRNHIIGKLNRLGRVGDGTRTPGTNQHSNGQRKADRFNPRTYKPFAPPVSTGSVAKEGERLSLDVPPPPPPIISTWTGIVATIDQVRADECRWPLPEGQIKPTGFCRAPTEPKQSYCPYHQHRSANDRNN